MASRLVGELLKGVGGVAVEHAKSTIDENRTIRMEKLRQAGRASERGEERIYQTGVRGEERTYQKGVRKGEQAFTTSERKGGEEALAGRQTVGIKAKKAAATAARTGMNKPKRSIKNDDGTITIIYEGGSAAIADPVAGTITKFEDLAASKQETKRGQEFAADAAEMYENISAEGEMFTFSRLADEFKDKKEYAIAKATEALKAGTPPSEVLNMLMTGEAADSDTAVEDDKAPSTSVTTSPTLATDKKQPAGMPDPAQHTGRIIKDKTTGARYKSDGTAWVEQ